MKWLFRLLLRVITVIVLSYFLPGVHLSTASDVETFKSAFYFAIILSVFNTFLRPVLSLFSFPITFLTFGLFQLVINTFMVILADKFVDGFEIDGFLKSLIFTIFFSVFSSIIEFIVSDDKK